jgi:hypothetical protein
MCKAIRISALVAVVAAALPALAQNADAPPADAHPIIAELYADPARFDGRSVTIYGLVIETFPNSIFLLQDVSQRPLKIVGSEKLKAAVGDQLIVVGSFHSAPGGSYLAARSIIPTRVLAGGGCC